MFVEACGSKFSFAALISWPKIVNMALMIGKLDLTSVEKCIGFVGLIMWKYHRSSACASEGAVLSWSL